MFEREEILEQIRSLETNSSEVFDENQRLRQELETQQNKIIEMENQNLRWKEEVKLIQDRKTEVEEAYELLTEKYEQLQTAYDSVLNRLMVPRLDASTDPLLDNDYFQNIIDTTTKYEQLEVVSEKMRKELETQSLKMKTLEAMMNQNVSTVNTIYNVSDNQFDDELRGAKITAHSAMLEIKKLLIDAAKTIQELPIDEAYDTVRKETEMKCAERVKSAILFCEKVFSEMEKCEVEGKECEESFELPEMENTNGIEFIISKLHERWRTKHHQLLESTKSLENQQQLCRELESRLSNAQEKLAEIESKASSEYGEFIIKFFRLIW